MATPRERMLPSLCHKTRLCKFFAMGSCSRGEQCSFAHRVEDLQPTPDLTRTQVCPLLNAQGFCNLEHCQYAHDMMQLRKGPFGVASTMIIRRRERTMRQILTTPPGRVETSLGGVAADPNPLNQEMPSDKFRPVVADQEMQDELQASTRKSTKTEKAHRRRAAALQKTRLCIYFQSGHCFKKSACNFAHSLDELRDVRRSAQQPPALEDAPLRAVGLPEYEPAAALADQPIEVAEPPVQPSRVSIYIKNTFLETAVVEPYVERCLRRSASCPALRGERPEQDALSDSGAHSLPVSPLGSEWERPWDFKIQDAIGHGDDGVGSQSLSTCSSANERPMTPISGYSCKTPPGSPVTWFLEGEADTLILPLTNG